MRNKFQNIDVNGHKKCGAGVGGYVIWDNVSAHKDSIVKVLIECRGASLLGLMSYSHSLNPIENAFSI